MTWEVISNSPKVMVAYKGGMKYGIYQQGQDGYAWTVRAMYSPGDENEPEWCDAVKPIVCPSLRRAMARAEALAR